MLPSGLKILHGPDPQGSRQGGAAEHPARGSKNPADGTIRSPLVVLGATGVIGRAVVRAAVETGRPVVAMARDLRHLEQLRLELPGSDVTVLAGTIAGDADGERLAAMLRRDGRPIAGVVDAMSGDTGRGRLIDHPTEVLRRAFDDDLLPHLSAARPLIPLLAEAKRGGSYVLIGGPGSETPWSNYGFRSVAAAALRMLACVLHDEAHSLDVRVQLLLVDAPVRGDLPCRHACPEWPSAVAVGRRALQLIERGIATEPARAVVHYARGVDSAATQTTTSRREHTDVRSFLKGLSSLDRNEVFPDDTP